MEELRRKIEWELLLSKGERLRFPVRILPDEKSELKETDLDSSNDLLGILHKVLMARSGKKHKELKYFEWAYLTENNKCFSNTVIDQKDGTMLNLICFSGLWDKNIVGTIEIIKNSTEFHPCKVVDVNRGVKDGIRYYWSQKNYITLGQAVKCNVFNSAGKEKDGYNLMFSCCERKTLADYDWNKCSSYTMYVKFPPCQMCADSVKRHTQKYGGRIVVGKRSMKPFVPDVVKKAKFDALAECIAIHKK